MISSAPEVVALVDRAKRFAALSGTFDPKQALAGNDKLDERLIVEVATVLAAGCDTNPDSGEGWLLRTAERRHILKTLRDGGQLAEAVQQRRAAADVDPETDDLLSVLLGERPFTEDDIARDLAASPSRDRVQRIIVALDRAGDEAELGLLQSARSVLAQMDRDVRRRQLEERGFFGREQEQASLIDWLESAQTSPPVQAAFVSGLPGIGKSALLEKITGSLNAAHDGLTVRLDFDRAGLGIIDVRGLTMEVARQVGERLGTAGGAILEARLGAASLELGEDSASIPSSRHMIFPADLASAIGRGLRAARRPVLLILDTLEVLRARGVEHPRRLFDWIDDLVRHDVAPIRIIAAGRGNALDSCPERVGLSVQLDGIDSNATAQLLERLDVASKDRDAVASVADGNPLVLRLAAEIATRFGKENLPRERLEKEVAAAFLYRFLLSRIEDPLLRRLAHPGLVLRRISAELVRDVLAPLLGIEGVGDKEARDLFSTLASEHWLVTPDPVDKDFVIHRSDMRLALLPLLYRDEPQFCAKIDSEAVNWFGKRHDPESEVDAAYHRLQLMRRGRRSRPMISKDVIFRFDDQMIAELPVAARNLVRTGQGERSEQFREGTAYSDGIDDDALAKELTALIERQDWAEGQYLAGQAMEAGTFDARSIAADAVRAFCWRAGRWSDARRLLAERDRLGGGDADLRELPRPLAIARIEMRAEFGRLNGSAKEVAQEFVVGEGKRSGLNLARHGALAFQLLTRGNYLFLETDLGRGADPVAATIEQWGVRTGHAARQAIDLARERLTARGASIGETVDSVSAQMVAVHSPYAGTVANLSTQAEFPWLGIAAGEIEARLCDMGGLFVPPLKGSIAPTPSNPVTGIAGLGLLAEWIDLLGFVRRDANLRTIGRAAERWRQTVAGNWRYGRPPVGWSYSNKLDVTLGARTRALGEERNPASAAMKRLQSLLGPDLSVERLRERLLKTLESAAQAESADEIAANLQRWRVPAAIVPPLAILIAHDALDLRRKIHV